MFKICFQLYGYRTVWTASGARFAYLVDLPAGGDIVVVAAAFAAVVGDVVVIAFVGCGSVAIHCCWQCVGGGDAVTAAAATAATAAVVAVVAVNVVVVVVAVVAVVGLDVVSCCSV